MRPVGNAAPNSRPAGEYRIGRYRIRARIGKGGMGVVYLGRDEALGRNVAIKTLGVEGPLTDEGRGRFEIEAKAAARLQHSNIVTVFELGEDRGLPYIAMELLGGQDLDTLLRSGERPGAAECLNIAIQTLRGLDYAHAHRIVHRDVKPSNIQVLDDGGVKILDFGIAKVGNTAVTRAGMTVGTPYYMSPEHIRGRTLDGRSDIFALGVILHEMFAGKRPFPAEEANRVLDQILNEPHPRLKSDAAGVLTLGVQRVIDRALEKAVDARYDSAAEMADELGRLLASCPVPQLTREDLATLSEARKGLAAGRPDASMLRGVEGIIRRKPDATEARQLFRLLRRELADEGTTAPVPVFPELDAAFRRTAREEEKTATPDGKGGDRAETPPAYTVPVFDKIAADPPAVSPEYTVPLSDQKAARRAEIPKPETLPPDRRGRAGLETRAPAAGRRTAAPSPAPHTRGILFGAIATSVAIGAIAGVLYFGAPSGSEAPEPTPTPPNPEVQLPGPRPEPRKPPAVAAPKRPAPTPAGATMEIRSRPPGATIQLDRKTIGVTPLKTEVAAAVAHSITLSLQGYESKDLRVAAPIPALVEQTLTPVVVPGRMVVESPYPVTVSVSGRVIATNEPGVATSLPPGTYEVLIESGPAFLQRRESVTLAAGGSFTIQVPPAGKIGVRANPDNCRVFIDGVFVDFPPILDRTITAGSHVVVFKWPDGTQLQDKTVVQSGRLSYVFGRKPLRMPRVLAPMAALLALAGVLSAQPRTDDQAKRLLEVGRADIQNGRGGAGLTALQTILTGFPNSPYAAEALLDIGRYAEEVDKDLARAREAYDQIVRKYPQSDAAPGAYLRMGRLAFADAASREALDDALGHFQRVIRLYPESPYIPDALVAAAAVFRRIGRFDSAIDSARRAVLDHPSSDTAAEGQFELAQSLVMAGEVLEGIEEFQRVRTLHPASAAAARALNATTALFRLYANGKAVFQRDPAFSVPAGEALKDVRSLAVTPLGALWIASSKTKSAVSFDPELRPGPSLFAEDPQTLAVSPRGEVVFASRLAVKVGTAVLTFSTPGERPGAMETLDRIGAAAIMVSGDILVSDLRRKRVVRFKGSTFASFFPDRTEREVTRLLSTTKGDVVMLRKDDKTIEVIDYTGRLVSKLGPRGAGFEWKKPVDVAVDAFSNLYLADEEQGIFVLSPKGELMANFGAAEVKKSRAIAIDATGAALVYDDRGEAIVRFK